VSARALAIAAIERGTVALMRHGPPAWGHRWAGFLGRRLVPPLHPGQMACIRHNIATLRPDLPPEESAATAMEHITRGFCEAAVFWRFWEEGRVEVAGEENLGRNPSLFIGLHTGQWELLPVTGARFGHRGVGPHQKPPSTFRERVLQEGYARTRAVGPLPDGPHMGARLAAALRRGDTLLLHLDETLTSGIPTSPRLGRALSPTGNLLYAARLWHMTGVAPQLAWVERLPGPRFRVHIGPPLEVPRGGGRQAEIRACMQALDDAADAVVRANLLQWLFLSEFAIQGSAG